MKKKNEKIDSVEKTAELLELFDDLTELVELNSQNNINFSRMGGITVLIYFIFQLQNDQIRKAACRTFVSVTANNLEVQTFAIKTGACNLSLLLEF